MAAGNGVAGSDHHPEIDWEGAERSPEFQELMQKKRSFVVPATAFFMVWYFGFIILAGYAPDFLGESIYEGFTVGYLFALTQFVMVWVLAGWYLRRANNVFEPLEERARDRALELSGFAGDEAGAEAATERARTRRFDPDATEPATDGRPAGRAAATAAGEARR